MAPMGPVHVRLTGVVRGDEKGPGISIVNAPTAAEATAELHRVARVAGADKVVSVASDYRRAALAGGTASTQWRIEVQAWGTAMAPGKVEPAEEPEEQRAQEADKAKDQDVARKANDAQAESQDEASETQAEPAVAAQPAPETPAPSPAPAPSAAPEAVYVSAAAPSGDAAPVPSAPPASER